VVAAAIARLVKPTAAQTHYTHWFQTPHRPDRREARRPSSTPDGHGGAMSSFSGLGPHPGRGPDGLVVPLRRHPRHVSRARGYTAWEPRPSPVFVNRAGNTVTLCIPTAFVSLDRRGSGHQDAAAPFDGRASTPRRCASCGSSAPTRGVSRVITTLGPEQEYFLVDRKPLSFARPRPAPLRSHASLAPSPPRGQQLEDHYFRLDPPRACLAYMSEVEKELYKLGVPVKTAPQRGGPPPSTSSRRSSRPPTSPATTRC